MPYGALRKSVQKRVRPFAGSMAVKTRVEKNPFKKSMMNLIRPRKEGIKRGGFAPSGKRSMRKAHEDSVTTGFAS